MFLVGPSSRPAVARIEALLLPFIGLELYMSNRKNFRAFHNNNNRAVTIPPPPSPAAGAPFQSAPEECSEPTTG